MIPDGRRVRNRLRQKFYGMWARMLPDDGFLREVPGVIHVGANSGQERDKYAASGLNVIWIEPIPSVFEALQGNIAAYPKQRAFRSLLAAEHGAEYDFHISSNAGASSSIFQFAGHKDIWPGIDYVEDIRIAATTLTRLLETEKIDLNEYGALVLDTQGSELLVLKGAIDVLNQFRFVKAEAADFEMYAGSCQLEDLAEFMRRQGFTLRRKTPFARREAGGTYYDVVFARVR